jgi:hypothetical protein
VIEDVAAIAEGRAGFNSPRLTPPERSTILLYSGTMIVAPGIALVLYGAEKVGERTLRRLQ